MAGVDLSTLDPHRHVHKAHGVSKIVETHAELKRAIAEGWCLLPPAEKPAKAAKPAKGKKGAKAAVEPDVAPGPVDEAPYEPPAAPAKGRKKARKPRTTKKK